MTDTANIAVLGAGMQGTTVALELARRGCSVDLFDRGAQPITAAGLQNEGKLHLGFVYGNDPSLRTTRRIAAGSLRFMPLIRRWAGAEVERIRLATPFFYAVPNDSILPPEAVRKHFCRVEQCVRQLVKQHDAIAVDSDYPGLEDALFRPLPDAQRDGYFSPDTIAAAFATGEIAVDPVSIAEIVRRAVAASPRIRFVPHARVRSVELRGDGYIVVTSPVETRSDRKYDHVVNALWDGRLAIDREMGLLPDRAWLWRYKAGLRLSPRDDVPRMASVTFMLGSFGDIVQYQNGAVYLCWYPAGLLGLSSDLTPPDHWQESGALTREGLAPATFDALARLCPDIDLLRPMADSALVDVVGGVIFAWGATNIDDPDSELHRRYDIGVTSSGGYHSVNTGKYCMAPVLAIEVADAIVPDAPRSLP